MPRRSARADRDRIGAADVERLSRHLSRDMSVYGVGGTRPFTSWLGSKGPWACPQGSPNSPLLAGLCAASSLVSTRYFDNRSRSSRSVFPGDSASGWGIERCNAGPSGSQPAAPRPYRPRHGAGSLRVIPSPPPLRPGPLSLPGPLRLLSHGGGRRGDYPSGFPWVHGLPASGIRDGLP